MNERLERAEDYIWRNARLLERHLFAFLFRGGDAGLVVPALRPYQNRDGGFGNALEPDMRGPHSQPFHTEFALRVLDSVDAMDNPLVERALDWLRSVTLDSGGVPWVLPVVEDYPSAPWWRGSDSSQASLGATAAIAGLLFKNGVGHPWLDGAARFCWQSIGSSAPDIREFHQLSPASLFLQHVPDRVRGEAEAGRLGRMLLEEGMVESAEEAGAYAKVPLMWAPEPDSPWRSLFSDDRIEADLDALAGRQEADGSWPLGFPLTSPAAEHEWRGRITIEALLTLRAYGRLD
jgi:hypothetical protein